MRGNTSYRAARPYAPRRRRHFNGGKNRGGPQSAHLWWPAVAAGSQRAYSLGSCAMGQTDNGTDRQTDGSRYSKMSA